MTVRERPVRSARSLHRMLRVGIASVALGLVAAGATTTGAWASTPTTPSAVSMVRVATEITDAAASTAAPFRATRFQMYWMGTVTQVARIDFVGDPRAVVYPGYYPDGTVIGPDKTPQPEVDMNSSGEGTIWFSYDAPSGYRAFTQVIDGVASGAFGLYMDDGNEIVDNFTASIADISAGVDDTSTVRLEGDLPYWYGNRIEVVVDGGVLASVDSNTGVTWSLDIANVPAGEHHWEVRLVAEGEIIMVRDVTVITTPLETPLVHPAALAVTGVAGLLAAGLMITHRRRPARVA